MMPCCLLTYGLYINKDGSIDNNRLAAYLKKAMEDGLSQQESDDFMANPCTCLCHQDGVLIMH